MVAEGVECRVLDLKIGVVKDEADCTEGAVFVADFGLEGGDHGLEFGVVKYDAVGLVAEKVALHVIVAKFDALADDGVGSHMLENRFDTAAKNGGQGVGNVGVNLVPWN